MRPRILLVEDEPGLVVTLSDLLAGEGYEVDSVRDGDAALRAVAADPPSLMVLDVMLPGMSGFEVCKSVRERGLNMPVLMLTARTQVADRVQGLKLGADDYLAKPFDPAELLARIEALLRRTRSDGPTPVTRFEFSDIAVDFDRAEVTRAGERLALTGKELQLLRYLIDNRGQVVSRDELLKNVWEYQESVTSRTVDVHVSWLRQKLEVEPQTPRHFHTVRGVGYRFAP
jgi:two-component system OmpR family response regulator